MDPLTEKERAKEEIVYDSHGSNEPDFEAQHGASASGGLARQLKGRHMQMIAIGM